ncbi:hypothetical protein ACFC0M_40415 [Streptomyces sp. NPDC056149]|uniref:hypothetical protein n=1 Tax=Streptomyces TaxID=1883 RepID=UPI0035D71F64
MTSSAPTPEYGAPCLPIPESWYDEHGQGCLCSPCVAAEMQQDRYRDGIEDGDWS